MRDIHTIRTCDSTLHCEVAAIELTGLTGRAFDEYVALVVILDGCTTLLAGENVERGAPEGQRNIIIHARGRKQTWVREGVSAQEVA